MTKCRKDKVTHQKELCENAPHAVFEHINKLSSVRNFGAFYIIIRR